MEEIKHNENLLNEKTEIPEPTKEITREDFVVKADNTKEIMKLIPEKEDCFVKVKSILNK